MFSEWTCQPRPVTRREMAIIWNNWAFRAAPMLYMGDDVEVVSLDDPAALHNAINRGVGD